jgi:putative flippase GtrA
MTWNSRSWKIYRSDTIRVTQIIRYGIVGLLSNTVGYLIYLLITFLGVGPRVAMTGLYVLGAVTGFIGSRNWTFLDQGPLSASIVRYGIAHSLGYALNFSLLVLFVDKLGFRHQWVQGASILIVAGFLFLMFRFFVFPPCAASDAGRE